MAEEESQKFRLANFPSENLVVPRQLVLSDTKEIVLNNF